jgi:hypothetical protein
MVFTITFGFNSASRPTNISTRPATAAIFHHSLLAVSVLGVANLAHPQAG